MELYDQAIGNAIRKYYPQSSLNPISDACSYALNNLESNRLRSKIVLIVSNIVNSSIDLIDASIGIECLVMAAKVADDMPSMDNSDKRGNNLSLHLKYDNQTALLVTYALISECFTMLAKNNFNLINKSNINDLPLRFSMVNKEVAESFGPSASPYGQYLDLNNNFNQLSEKSIIKIIDLKTSRLYQAAFATGWLLSGGSLSEVNLLKKLGVHLGRAMQMQDDLADIKQDYDLNRKINISLCYGKDRAKHLIKDELRMFENTMDKIKLIHDSEELIKILKPINRYLNELEVSEGCG